MKTLVAVVLSSVCVPAVAYAANHSHQERISRDGVGRVRIGAKYATLHQQRLLGRSVPVCPQNPAGTVEAPLTAPLRGFAALNLAGKVDYIDVDGGGQARGIGRGSSLAAAEHAFPKARVTRPRVEGVTFIVMHVPRSEGGPFNVNSTTQTDPASVTDIEIPRSISLGGCS